jgi:hypothetical protein
MQRISAKHQLWISMATTCICVGIAFIILSGLQKPSSKVMPVNSIDLPITLSTTSQQPPIDQRGQERLLLAGLNCLRKRVGLPLFEEFDTALSQTAAQSLTRLSSEDKVLESLEGYTIRALLALDFTEAQNECSVGGVNLSFLSPLTNTTKVGVAFSQTTSYGTTSAVLLGR